MLRYRTTPPNEHELARQEFLGGGFRIEDIHGTVQYIRGVPNPAVLHGTWLRWEAVDRNNNPMPWPEVPNTCRQRPRRYCRSSP